FQQLHKRVWKCCIRTYKTDRPRFAKIPNPLSPQINRVSLKRMPTVQKSRQHPKIRTRTETNNMADDKNTKTSGSSSWREICDAMPFDELKNNFTDYVSAWGEKAIHGLGDKVTGLIDRVSSGTDGSSAMGEAAQEGAEKLAEGDSPVTAGLSGAATGVK